MGTSDEYVAGRVHRHAVGQARLATFFEVARSKAICGPCPTPYNMVDAAKVPSALVIWRTPVRSPGYLGENLTLIVQVEPAISDNGQLLPPQG